MKKYRIVKKTNGAGDIYYVVQYRCCLFSWLTIKDPNFMSLYSTKLKEFYSLEDAIFYVENSLDKERKRRIVESKVIIEY